MACIRSFVSVLWIILSIVLSPHLIAQSLEEEDIKIDDEPVYTNLSKALRNADKVYKLSLTNKEFDEFPIDILKLKQLRVLTLDSNKIASIPQEIGTLEHLRFF
jgi:Leucine-rich repeat (LRR) protein